MLSLRRVRPPWTSHCCGRSERKTLLLQVQTADNSGWQICLILEISPRPTCRNGPGGSGLPPVFLVFQVTAGPTNTIACTLSTPSGTLPWLLPAQSWYSFLTLISNHPRQACPCIACLRRFLCLLTQIDHSCRV